MLLIAGCSDNRGAASNAAAEEVDEINLRVQKSALIDYDAELGVGYARNPEGADSGSRNRCIPTPELIDVTEAIPGFDLPSNGVVTNTNFGPDAIVFDDVIVPPETSAVAFYVYKEDRFNEHLGFMLNNDSPMSVYGGFATDETIDTSRPIGEETGIYDGTTPEGVRYTSTVDYFRKMYFDASEDPLDPDYDPDNQPEDKIFVLAVDFHSVHRYFYAADRLTLDLTRTEAVPCPEGVETYGDFVTECGDSYLGQELWGATVFFTLRMDQLPGSNAQQTQLTKKLEELFDINVRLTSPSAADRTAARMDELYSWLEDQGGLHLSFDVLAPEPWNQNTWSVITDWGNEERTSVLLRTKTYSMKRALNCGGRGVELEETETLEYRPEDSESFECDFADDPHRLEPNEYAALLFDFRRYIEDFFAADTDIRWDNIENQENRSAFNPLDGSYGFLLNQDFAPYEADVFEACGIELPVQHQCYEGFKDAKREYFSGVDSTSKRMEYLRAALEKPERYDNWNQGIPEEGSPYHQLVELWDTCYENKPSNQGADSGIIPDAFVACEEQMLTSLNLDEGQQAEFCEVCRPWSVAADEIVAQGLGSIAEQIEERQAVPIRRLFDDIEDPTTGETLEMVEITIDHCAPIYFDGVLNTLGGMPFLDKPVDASGQIPGDAGSPIGGSTFRNGQGVSTLESGGAPLQGDDFLCTASGFGGKMDRLKDPILRLYCKALGTSDITSIPCDQSSEWGIETRWSNGFRFNEAFMNYSCTKKDNFVGVGGSTTMIPEEEVSVLTTSNNQDTLLPNQGVGGPYAYVTGAISGIEGHWNRRDDGGIIRQNNSFGTLELEV
ncbi:MAG: hypothetical protein AAGI01_05090, partial [Myxococcota bacterium]